jgi:hypothetical protein
MSLLHLQEHGVSLYAKENNCTGDADVSSLQELLVLLVEIPDTSLGFSSFAARVIDELVVVYSISPPPLLVAGARSGELGRKVKPPPVLALVLAAAAGAAAAGSPNEKAPPLLPAGAGVALKGKAPGDELEDSFDFLLAVGVGVLVEAPPAKVNPEEDIAPPDAGLSPAGAGAEEDPALPGRAVSQERQAVLSSLL